MPQDIRLSPLTVLYWFYGDGTTTRQRRRNRRGVNLKLCTHGFTMSECKMLVDKFHAIDPLLAFRAVPTPKGPYISAQRSETVNAFFDYIGQNTINCFNYKFKRPFPKLTK